MRPAPASCCVIVCVWTALLWRFASGPGVKRLALLVAGNLALNLAFFVTHPVFTQYYVIPIAMLTLWTLLFATILSRERPAATDGPQALEMLSRQAI